MYLAHCRDCSRQTPAYAAPELDGWLQRHEGMNKGGEPDRRFSNHPIVPIVRYGISI